MSDKVLNRLEEAILKGEFPPGSRLLERDLAAELGVSRVPVREALQVLERWGLVKRLNQGGRIRVVAARTREDIISAYKLRSMLEGQAFCWQALVGNLELLDKLQHLVAQMDELAETDDIEQYRPVNTEFHLEIIKAANNKKLNDVYMDVNRMIRWYHAKTFYKPRMKSSNLEHKKMLTAYLEKDLAAINLLFMKHHKHAAEIIAGYVEKNEDQEVSSYDQMKETLLKSI